MHQSGKKSSLEAIEWLEYENSRSPYPNKIEHALNGGEKQVAGYFVDGFLELTNPDGLPYTFAFEYMDTVPIF